MARSGLAFPPRWVKQFEVDRNYKRQVLSVRRALPGSDACAKFKEGDLLLAIDGQTMLCFRDVEVAVNASSAQESVKVT